MSRNDVLKPIDEQTIVITGASSGIGLATARMAADRGAELVLAARSEDALGELVAEIEADGGAATDVVADVSDRDDVREIARTARETFGGFDTWVNGAGVSIYGRLDEVPVADMRRLFDVNVWGTVYGSLAAAEHLRERGGAILNVGSIVSDRSLLLQGSYAASKHAVKGFTDALRMELDDADAPVSVTLIKPSSIDTPYPQHAKNYMDEAPTLPPPLYAPETVARAILHAAAHPDREVTVGGGGKLLTTLGHYAPSVLDAIMERVFTREQRSGRPPRSRTESGLDGPSGELDERGDYAGHVAETSLYTRIRQRRTAAATLAGLAATLVYAGYRALRSDEGTRGESSRTATERVRNAAPDGDRSGRRFSSRSSR